MVYWPAWELTDALSARGSASGGGSCVRSPTCGGELARVHLVATRDCARTRFLSRQVLPFHLTRLGGRQARIHQYGRGLLFGRRQAPGLHLAGIWINWWPFGGFPVGMNRWASLRQSPLRDSLPRHWHPYSP